jgi:predicted Zn-dependent protease
MLAALDLSDLKLVRVGSALPDGAMERFGEWIEGALGSFIRDVRRVQYNPPPFDEIETALLTQALEHEVGGHILAVTEVDLLEHDREGLHPYMFGGKDNRNAVAVVSTRRLHSRDGSLMLERVGKVALHELGHNLGLVHHYSFEPADDGAYCPMSKGDFGRYGERGYVRAVIDGRGLRYCRRCLDWLRRAVPRQSIESTVPSSSL